MSKKIYTTSHNCHKNQVTTNRYWIADDETSKLIHIGVCDIDKSFMNLLASNLDAEFIDLDMPDDAFKKLMLAEGYEQ